MINQHLVPPRVADPVNYVQRERAAIAESTPAGKAAAAAPAPAPATAPTTARERGAAERVARPAEQRAPVEATAPTAPTFRAETATAPAPTVMHAGTPAEYTIDADGARRGRTIAGLLTAFVDKDLGADQVDALHAAAASETPEAAGAARRIRNAAVLALLPEAPEAAMTRAALVQAMGLSGHRETSRLNNALTRLQRTEAVAITFRRDGMLCYYRRAPLIDAPPAQLPPRWQTLLDVLPATQADGVPLSAVLQRFNAAAGEQASAQAVRSMLQKMIGRGLVGPAESYGAGTNRHYWRLPADGAAPAAPVPATAAPAAEDDALDYDSAFELAPGLETAQGEVAVTRACPLNGEACDCAAFDICVRIAAGEHGPVAAPALDATDHAAADALVDAINAVAEALPAGDLPGDAVLHAEVPAAPAQDLPVWAALQRRSDRYALFAEALGQFGDLLAGWSREDAARVLREATEAVEEAPRD